MDGTEEEVHTKFWQENLQESDHWKDLGVDGNIILCLMKYDREVWTGTSGRFLRTR
jgi:hypothetical protein